MISVDDLAQLAGQANAAPSVHNTQPTRWRLQDGAILVLEDAARRLSVCDPTGRDAAISHGAAIEGFSIACAQRGLNIRTIPAADGSGAPLRSLVRIEISPGADRDPLAGVLALRRTWRGRFVEGAPSPLDRFDTMPDVTVVRGREAVAALAELNDQAGLRTFRDAAYRAELVSWMRLTRRDPRWGLDGLNAEAMAMSRLEALGAGLVLRPGVFEAFDRLGIARPLVAEAAVVRSALAVLLFHRRTDEDPVSTGRRFHRLWLEITAAGLAAAPMAVLADDPPARARIVAEYGIGSDQRLVTAFRIGHAPTSPRSPKPRLPVGQLLV